MKFYRLIIEVDHKTEAEAKKMASEAMEKLSEDADCRIDTWEQDEDGTFDQVASMDIETV